MPTVAIAYTEEKQRSIERVFSLLDEALEYLGGIGAFVRPGESVLIKPNQSAFSPAAGGATTDPLVVGALIRMLRNAGAAKIQVAEASDPSLDALECMRMSGMAAIAEREGAELIDLASSRTATREVVLPEGKVVQRVPLPVPLLEAGAIIAAPKAKTHYLDTVAGVMELFVRVVDPKWRVANLKDGTIFGGIADIMTVIRPDLSITDALICGEGDGPDANLPHWCGCLLASSDPIAMDVTIARIMRRDERQLKFAAAGEERGLGSQAPIVWLGTSLERIAIDAWPAHRGHRYLPVNLLVGEGVTVPGTIGHVRNALDTLLRRGILEDVISTLGIPTVMLGDVEDPKFEQHLAEGPYLVFDDAARPEYKEDPRVYFVPGHPVLDSALPQLIRGLRMASSGGKPSSRSPLKNDLGRR